MNIKSMPILFKAKDECCGCGLCSAICPSHAIEMIEDEEGFLYPKIQDERCIRCYLCVKKCSFKGIVN